MKNLKWKENQAKLKNTIEHLELDNLFVHSDSFKSLNYIDFNGDVESSVRKHIEFILSLSNKIILPSFNYDFPRERLFNYNDFSCQVGAIPEFYRKNYSCFRTFDPMFSLIKNYGTSQLSNYQSEVCSFEQHGHFEVLTKKGSGILCYGTNIEVVTFIHYIESLFNIDYRYEKKFIGKVKIASEILPLSYKSHFRPWGKYLNYDWKKISDDLKGNGIMHSLSKYCHVIESRKLFLYWSERIQDDSLYFLDNKSCEWVKPKLDQLGRPFVQSDFEVLSND
ncbi:MAG: AAC(3) family N-acetyltransferase [Colwellia sp.]|jgi:Aminoglycoside N3''-acetyltransferase